jgi:hypothetical protein
MKNKPPKTEPLQPSAGHGDGISAWIRSALQARREKTESEWQIVYLRTADPCLLKDMGIDPVSLEGNPPLIECRKPK